MLRSDKGTTGWIMARGNFHWDDPLLLEEQLTDEEKMVRDAARDYAQGRLDAALAEYRRVLEIDPQNADAMASIGAILARQGQLDAGIAILHKALAIDPDNPTAKQNLLAAMKKQSR